MKVLLLGATGLVGGEVLKLALDHPQVTKIIAPVRKTFKISHSKLESPVINFDDFSDIAQDWQFDAVICALGTTMKQAKSKNAFKKIDLEYPLAFAQLAKDKGCKIYALNSAVGANADSRIFYNQVKGQLENQLTQLQFESLVFVRPGLIDGDRKETRLGESLGLKLSSLLKPVLPKSLQPNKAQDIAFHLLQGVISPVKGVQMIEAAQIHC